ncbi:MAG: hypothetical protein OEM97_01770 [Acidimicrobiia bacterium]|nr:hypothetical protein [Acidimicrobiia bacterium]
MRSSEQERRSHAPGAFAIVKGDPPEVLLAENAAVMSRLVALRIVATSDPARFSETDLIRVRDALLEERWADAVVLWMETMSTFIDVYEEYVPVWTESDLDEEFASLEIRVSRIFNQDPNG